MKAGCRDDGFGCQAPPEQVTAASCRDDGLGCNGCCTPAMPAKTPTKKVEELDLDLIVQQLIKKQWTLPDAKHAKKGYITFLNQVLADRFTKHKPEKEVDEFWHQHILNTKKYVEDCQAIFGHYLHHQPAPVGNYCSCDCDNDCASKELRPVAADLANMP